MLKRASSFLLALALSTLALTSPASASPETAEDWGVKASALYGKTTALLSALNEKEPSPLEEGYINELAHFSVIAGRLAIWVDTSGGAKDFGCIYRGMAEEAELQLETLESAKTRVEAKAALTRIATMLDDAQSIAVASAYAARHGDEKAATGHCPASAAPLDQYLGAGRGS